MTEELIGNSKPLGIQGSQKLLRTIERELSQGIAPNSPLLKVYCTTLRSMAEEATRYGYVEISNKAIELLEMHDKAFKQAISMPTNTETVEKLDYAEFVEQFKATNGKTPYEVVLDSVSNERACTIGQTLRFARALDISKFSTCEVLTSDGKAVVCNSEADTKQLHTIVALNESLKNKVSGIPAFNIVVESTRELPSKFSRIKNADNKKLTENNHIIKHIVQVTYTNAMPISDQILKVLSACKDIKDIDTVDIIEDNDNIERTISDLNNQIEEMTNMLSEGN